MQVAQAALSYVSQGTILGVGTGSTVNCFIDALIASKIQIQAAVSSSQSTTERLTAANIEVISLTKPLNSQFILMAPMK